MPANANTNTSATPKAVLHAIHNLPKKVKSRGQLRAGRRGKENAAPPSATAPALPTRPAFPARSASASASAAALAASESFSATRWAPQGGTIIVKVAVPCMDDLWRLRVAEDISLARLTRRAEAKIGFPVALSYAAGAAERAVRTEAAFRLWVDTRVQKGINTPLIARVRV